MKSKKSILSIAIFLLIAFVIAGCGVIPTQPKGAIEGREERIGVKSLLLTK